MSSINPNIKQLEQHIKMIKEVLFKFEKKIKYKFIKRNDEKTIIPPNNGVGFLCSFLILSGRSRSLVFYTTLLLYLLIK